MPHLKHPTVTPIIGGGWNRGDTTTLFAEWDVFNDDTSVFTDRLIIDNTPDQSSNITSASLTETTGGSFITASSNIYSFSRAIDFNASITGTGPAGATQVALQIETFGTEINPASVLLNSITPSITTEISRGGLGGTFGGIAVETLFIWNLATGGNNYNFDFTALEASLSLARVSIDIGPGVNQVTPVPLPAAVWMLLTGIGGMSYFSKRKTSSQG